MLKSLPNLSAETNFFNVNNNPTKYILLLLPVLKKIENCGTKNKRLKNFLKSALFEALSCINELVVAIYLNYNDYSLLVLNCSDLANRSPFSLPLAFFFSSNTDISENRYPGLFSCSLSPKFHSQLQQESFNSFQFFLITWILDLLFTFNPHMFI